jgi:GH25 family lysozyme M1 (1,4-beta-N-acetylmuramidase)
MGFNTFYGPDISFYQTITDWVALNKGAAFIMIKASGNDDGNYVDSKYLENIAQARSFGNDLPRIVYNYCGGTDAVGDANYFVDNVGVNLQVGEAYEFDCERGAAVTPAYALQALNQAKSRLGWGGGVYVSQSRLISEDWSPVADAGYFVHPADWIPTTDNFSVGAFKTYSFQQYTNKATWPGITTPCDGDAFFGDTAMDILKFGKPAAIAAPPAVVATPPIVVPTTPVMSTPIEPPAAPTPTPIAVTQPVSTPTTVPVTVKPTVPVTVEPTPEPEPAPVVVPADPTPSVAKANTLDVIVRSLKTWLAVFPSIEAASGLNILHISGVSNLKVGAITAGATAILNIIIKVYQAL